MAPGNSSAISQPHHLSDIDARWEPRTSHRDHYSDHLNGHVDTNGSLTPASSLSSSSSSLPPPLSPPSIDPQRSPSAIALRSHLLGFTLGASVSLTIYLASRHSPLWRLSFFLSALSIFHSLEFFVTARYNHRSAATTAAFLLDNGRAYNIAHLCAFSECLLRHLHPFLPFSRLPPSPSSSSSSSSSFSFFFGVSGLAWIVLGFCLMITGQTIRTVAMAQAGTNFNHVVQSYRKENHVLVTEGVYRFTRHPAYFGFFWWGLGTQVVLGNVVCLVGYAVVLWRFFKKRIDKEEEFLIRFFGQEYVKYKQRTGVGIPFIS